VLSREDQERIGGLDPRRGDSGGTVRIVLAGGTGQLGELLANSLHGAGHEVTVLSRNPAAAPWRTVQWDGRTMGEWAQLLEGADALVNLAGRSVNCRYHAKNRRQILDSRLASTRVLVQAMQAAEKPPRVWLQSSTATIYAHRFDAPNDEFTGIVGGAEPGLPDTWKFSLDVARSWEQVADEAQLPQTRLVKLRTAIVTVPSRGGALEILIRLVRFGLGGSAGDGQQFVSWIHADDFVRSILWIIDHPELEGVVNVAAPNPLPNRQFMAALRQAAAVPFGLPATSWMLEIGAFLLRTETELILKSRRVVPTRLLQSGFTFLHPTWPEAARDLVRKMPLPGAFFRATRRIRAPHEVAWEVMQDVERWHEWTESISRIEILDGKPFGPGSRVRIVQPGLQSFDWTVTEYAEGRSFTWCASGPGLRLQASHTLVPAGEGCFADLRLTFGGPLGQFVGWLGGKVTRKYMQMEAEGLQARSERGRT
jgi:uncharacterized protein